jgi:hypothetical protein
MTHLVKIALTLALIELESSFWTHLKGNETQIPNRYNMTIFNICQLPGNQSWPLVLNLPNCVSSTFFRHTRINLQHHTIPHFLKMHSGNKCHVVIAEYLYVYDMCPLTYILWEKCVILVTGHNKYSLIWSFQDCLPNGEDPETGQWVIILLHMIREWKRVILTKWLLCHDQ